MITGIDKIASYFYYTDYCVMSYFIWSFIISHIWLSKLTNCMNKILLDLN